MRSQPTSPTDASGALIPTLILFGGLTLLLIGLLASRPSVIPAKSSEVVSSTSAASAEITEVVPQIVAVALDVLLFLMSKVHTNFDMV